MKTKIARFAATAFAVASFSSFALGGQDFPIKRQTSGGGARVASCCVKHDHAKCESCCTRKPVVSGTFKGRASYSSFRKVHSCTMSAGTPAKANHASCCN